MNDENFPPSIDLLRSSSSNDVLTDSRLYEPSSSPSADHLRLIKSTVINSQPQDFVVTKGQTYRVNRSPLAIPLRGKKIHSIGDTESPELAKIQMLLKALDDANRKICEQNNELMTLQLNEAMYRKRIHALEMKCGEEVTKFPNDLVHIPAAMTMNKVDCGSFAVIGEDVKSADTPSRQRNKIQNALRNEKELKIRTFSPSLSHLASFEEDATRGGKLRSFSEVEECEGSFGAHLESNQSTPSSLDGVSVHLVRSSHDLGLPADMSVEDHGAGGGGGGGAGGGGGVIGHSPIKTDPDARLDNIILIDPPAQQSSCAKLQIPSSKSALAARLGMSAKDRRSKERVSEKQSSRPTVVGGVRKLKPTPPVVGESPCSVGSPVAPYVWRKAVPDSESCSCTLFIAHDNPQLGKTVADTISRGSMELMIESKALGKNIAFVLANIVFSGPVEKVLINSSGVASAASTTLPRGSQCLVCTDLRAFSFELGKDCHTRVQGVIAELDMCKERLPVRCSVDISTEEKLMNFFRSCDTRVDVILAPHHSQSWYPYWEYGSEPSPAEAAGRQPGAGARKMAPQFRSKGIGYLRLGDDMSNFGTSFLSCDGFETFMDEGKGGVEEKASSTSSVQTGGGKGRGGGVHVMGGPASGKPVAGARESSAGGGEDPAVSVADICNNQELAVVVNSMQCSDMKWSDRVACLSSLCDYLTRHVGSVDKGTAPIPSHILEDAAKCLLEQILSQKNPLVLKEATRCAGAIGCHFSVLNVYHDCTCQALAAAWTDLFIQCVHHLRHANRGVSEAAKASLSNLVGSRVVNMKTLGNNIKDLLAGPLRAGSTTQLAGPIAPNTARVLQWTVLVLEDYTKQIHQQKSHAEDVGVVAFTGGVSAEAPLGYIYTPADSNPIVAIAQSVVSLLNHKDVAVREAAVTVSAQLFSLDIMHCGKIQRLNLHSFSDKEQRPDETATANTNGSDLLPLPRDFSSLVNSLSAECKDMMTSSSVEKMVQTKVAQRSIEYVNKLYSNSKKIPENHTPVTTGESPPPPSALKKSLSSLGSQKHRRQRKLRRGSSSNVADDDEVNGTPPADPLADMLFEAHLMLKRIPSDDVSWERLSLVIKCFYNASPDSLWRVCVFVCVTIYCILHIIFDVL